MTIKIPRRAKIRVKRSKFGQKFWYWVAYAGNGEVFCQGEMHPKKSNAKRAAKRARVLMATARVIVHVN